MRRSELIDAYFEWMCQLVTGTIKSKRLRHRKLLAYLHSMSFKYILSMDGNRAEDGVSLRYRFGYEMNYADPVIAECLDDRDCSVLEMMVALAHRCEEEIMSDPELGDRTGDWFWGMVTSLGLWNMTDSIFNQTRVATTIKRFLNRQYNSDGSGGLFTVRDAMEDLRGVDIWYQMCWYLDTFV